MKFRVLEPAKISGKCRKVDSLISIDDEDLALELMEDGIVEMAESSSDDPAPDEKQDGSKSNEELLLEACRAAYQLDPNDSPNCPALKQQLGFTVSAAERDAAWEKVKAEQPATSSTE
ncbi:MAG: hypothetical protein HWE34_04400 [Methylocystaceae bacterium]|nr:hypothetical protein [Methylocystaceae bacterium]